MLCRGVMDYLRRTDSLLFNVKGHSSCLYAVVAGVKRERAYLTVTIKWSAKFINACWVTINKDDRLSVQVIETARASTTIMIVLDDGKTPLPINSLCWKAVGANNAKNKIEAKVMQVTRECLILMVFTPLKFQEKNSKFTVVYNMTKIIMLHLKVYYTYI